MLSYIDNLLPTGRIINVVGLGSLLNIASLIDVYLDTIPFGTGVPAVESILRGAAYITTPSRLNDEASLINILLDKPYVSEKHSDYDPILGVCSSFSESVSLADKLLKSSELRNSLNKIQARIFTDSILTLNILPRTTLTIF